MHGILNLSWVGYIVVTLVLTHITISGVTIYLHRCVTHRALKLHPVIEHFFRFWLWMTTGMVTKEWVAIHRKHHAKEETAEDPHSPQYRPFGFMLWRGVFYYHEAAQDKVMVERYGRMAPNDWIERNVYTPYCSMGIVFMFALDLVLFGFPGAIIWGVQMLWIPFFAAGVINGVGHMWGYRNFDTKDTSTNIVPWGVFIGGEELHNNHHRYPASARFRMKRWEFDLGWCYIRAMELLGLATVNKQRLVPLSPPADPLKLFRKRVLYPLLKEIHKEQELCVKSYKRAKALLKECTWSEDARAEWDVLIEKHPRLKKAWEYRVDLKDLLTQIKAEDFPERVRDYRLQLVASGMERVQRFETLLHVPDTQAA